MEIKELLTEITQTEEVRSLLSNLLQSDQGG